MRLESALNSSREGINTHGQAIAVVGDNVSNASTVGYKVSRVEFADIFSAGEAAPALPSTGSGSKVTTVRQLHEAGVVESTGRAMDVGIGGKGFFMVGTAEQQFYTRAGNFEIGPDGVVRTADGFDLLGFAGEQLEVLSPLNVLEINLTAEATANVGITGNINSEGAISAVPDNPQTFNQIAALASFVNSSEVFDSQGGRHNISLAFFKTAPGVYQVQSYVDGADLAGGVAGVPTALGAPVTLNFNTDGSIAAPEAARIVVAPQWANGVDAGNVTFDLSGFTQFAAPSSISGITRDGQSLGQIEEFEFDSQGGFFAKLDNGERVLVGTVPLAVFTNVDGLQRAGGARFAASGREGERTVFVPTAESVARLEPSALERSTVDLSNQFVELVIYQRGYQANSQTLNSANTLLRDTLSLLR